MSWISISAQNCSSTKMLFSRDHGHFWHQAGISKVTSSFWTFTISMGLVFRFSRVGASIIIIRKQWGKFHLPIRKEESRLPCTAPNEMLLKFRRKKWHNFLVEKLPRVHDFLRPAVCSRTFLLCFATHFEHFFEHRRSYPRALWKIVGG